MERKDYIEALKGKYTKKRNGCWEWDLSLTEKGYGRLRIGHKMFRAHRVAYLAHIGPIPKGRLVCHHCDNPKCVNPNHLYAGTPKQNTNDMMVRGRHKSPFVPEHNLKTKAS